MSNVLLLDGTSTPAMRTSPISGHLLSSGGVSGGGASGGQVAAVAAGVSEGHVDGSIKGKFEGKYLSSLRVSAFLLTEKTTSSTCELLLVFGHGARHSSRTGVRVKEVADSGQFHQRCRGDMLLVRWDFRQPFPFRTRSMGTYRTTLSWRSEIS